MGKKRKKSKLSQKKKSAKNSTQFSNIILAILFAGLLYFLYLTVPGYTWLVDSLVVNNLKIIFENSNMKIDQKYAAKLGADYQFINYIKQNTPEDAIILMPPRDVFMKSDLNKNSSWGVKSKTWSTYFLYPRIVIREEDCGNYPQLCDSISHVMVLESWGIDKLNYKVPPQKYGILPINSPGGQK